MLRDLTAAGANQKNREAELLPNIFFSADGKIVGAQREGDFFASSNQFGVRRHPVQLWDATTGKEMSQLGRVYLMSAAITPDGKRLVGMDAAATEEIATLGVWEVATSNRLTKLGELPFKLSQLVTYRGSDYRFSADGKRLAIKTTTVASHGEDAVQVWNLETGKQVPLPKDAMTVAFAPDGAALAVGTHSGLVQLCDSAEGKILHTWKGYQPSGGTHTLNLSHSTRRSCFRPKVSWWPRSEPADLSVAGM
jgi:WD40 repeat protein